MTREAHRYDHLTSPEAEQAQCDGALLILPVGALEQHGDGLPLGTDSIRADHVAHRVAGELAGRCFVLPTVPYGVSPHHRTLPGTVSLPPTLFAELIAQIAGELAGSGWRRLLVVTGHGGNAAALGVAQQLLLSSHAELAFAWSPVTALATEANGQLPRAEVTGHSGESETAQMLAIDETLVRRDHLRPGATSLAGLSPRALLSRTAKPSIAVTFDQYAPNGVLGDPTTATREDGEAILDEVVAAVTAYARRMLAL